MASGLVFESGTTFRNTFRKILLVHDRVSLQYRLARCLGYGRLKIASSSPICKLLKRQLLPMATRTVAITNQFLCTLGSKEAEGLTLRHFPETSNPSALREIWRTSS